MVELTEPGPAEFLVAFASPDGELLAVQTDLDAEIIVKDLSSGSELARYDIPGGMYPADISLDGRRLVVLDLPYSPGFSVWHVVDLQDGVRLSTIRAEGLHWVRFDPSGQRLIGWIVPRSLGLPGPRTPFLAAFAADTGEEVTRLELAGVAAGFWEEVRADDFTVHQFYEPGVALSKDGRRAAVLHADKEALTLVDTERMEILWTKSLRSSTSFLERLLGVRRAYAKLAEGVRWNLHLSPDGQWLYAFGDVEKFAPEDGQHIRGTGLLLIDVEQAEAVARGFEGQRIYWAATAPDWSAIYIYVEDALNHQTSLHRVLPHTLQSSTARSIEQNNLYFLVPASP